MPAQHVDRTAGGGIPHPDRSVRAPGGEAATVWAVGRSEDRPGMALQHAGRAAGRRVPEPDAAITAPHGQMLAIGAEGHGEHLAGADVDEPQVPPRLDLPEFQQAAIGTDPGRGQPAAIGAEGQGHDAPTAGREGPERLAIQSRGPIPRSLPQQDRAGKRAACDHRASRGDRDAGDTRRRPARDRAAGRQIPRRPFVGPESGAARPTEPGRDQPAAVGAERQVADRPTVPAQRGLLKVTEPAAVRPLPAAQPRRALVQERLGQGIVVLSPFAVGPIDAVDVELALQVDRPLPRLLGAGRRVLLLRRSEVPLAADQDEAGRQAAHGQEQHDQRRGHQARVPAAQLQRRSQGDGRRALMGLTSRNRRRSSANSRAVA